MKKLFYAVLTILCFACSNDDDANLPKFHYEVIPIEKATFPNNFKYNEEHEVTLEYNLPSGCYYFDRLYYVEEDTSRTVAVIALVEDESPCTQATKLETYTFNVKASQQEDYLFKVYKGKDAENKAIYEEITIPVLEEGGVND